VRWEAAQCPNVTRAEIDPRSFEQARASCLRAAARRELRCIMAQQTLTPALANGAANARTSASAS
jgi:hypothetical protein